MDPSEADNRIEDDSWIEAGKGYGLALDGDTIVARNAKGKRLKSVPAAVKKTEAFAELDGLVTWLASHRAECAARVETWLLRSLPVPTSVIASVWPDESWQTALRDLVISPLDDPEAVGFLRAATIEPSTHADGNGNGNGNGNGASGSAQLGVVNLDGESETIDAAEVLIPHPILLSDLDDLREFAAEIGVDQHFNQLHREVHRLPDPLPDGSVTHLDTWSGAPFDELRFASSRASSAGFAVQGGYALARIHEGGRLVEASFWIGSEAPDWPTETGPLMWISDGRMLPVREVGPVAYSEGVRMAIHIHAGRKVEEEQS